VAGWSSPSPLPAAQASPFIAPLPEPTFALFEEENRRLLQGRKFLRTREWKRAIREFQGAVSSEPKNPRCHAALAQALRVSGNLEKAQEATSDGLGECPGAPEILVELGRIHMARGNAAGALNVAERAREAGHHTAPMVRLHADAVARMEGPPLPDPNEVPVEDEPETDPVDGDDGDGDDGDGDDGDAKTEKKGPPPGASGERILRGAIAKKRSDAALHYELGDFLLEWKRPADAAIALRGAVKAAPDRMDYRIRLVKAFLLAKNVEEARAVAFGAVEHDPESAAAHNILGRTYEEAGEPAAAVPSYEDAIQRDPKNAGYLTDLGYVLTLTSAYKDAEKALRKAIKLSPMLTEARLHLAWLYNRQGKLKNALEEYAGVLKREPNHLDAMWFSAELQILLGKSRDAEKMLRKVIALQPDRSESHRLLAKALYVMGKTDDSVKALEESLDLDPRNPRALVLSGRLMEEDTQFEDAEKEYLEAIKCEPTYPWAYLYLAELQDDMLDKPEEALKNYKSFLNFGGPDEDKEVERRIEDLEADLEDAGDDK
jgi:tetratricopeptide (TPR) repeat protein